jgi:transposase
LEITSQVLYSQIDTVAWYLKPALLPEFKKVIESESVNIGDETWWWNLEKDTADKKDRFYLWGVRNKKAALFEIHDSRAQKVAKTFLGKLQGILVVDGYAGYNILESETLQLARCWFHLRRRFKAAEKNFPELADFFLNLIKKLCLIEREILLLTPEERLKLRQEKSKPVIDEIQARLQELDGAVLPRSSIGKAVSYGIKFWKGLTLFLEHPGVPIGTNDIELSLRHPVVGRKNHYGSKNLKTAETAAIWYSVIETCRIHQVDPRKYITQALKNILSKKPVLMPWDFKASS